MNHSSTAAAESRPLRGIAISNDVLDQMAAAACDDEAGYGAVRLWRQQSEAGKEFWRSAIRAALRAAGADITDSEAP